MPYQFPSGLQTLISSGWYITRPALSIKLSNDDEIHISTINEVVDDITYTDGLKSAGAVKQSLTRITDSVSLELWNADSQIGLALVDPVEALTGATATFKRIYINPSDVSEKYTVEELSGVLTIPAGAGAGDEILSLQLISDTAAYPTLMGVMPVLNSCVNRYKDGVSCPYSGDLPACDLTFDGSNGCRAHFEESDALRYFGGHSLNLDPGVAETLPASAPADSGVNTGNDPFPDRYGSVLEM